MLCRKRIQNYSKHRFTWLLSNSIIAWVIKYFFGRRRSLGGQKMSGNPEIYSHFSKQYEERQCAAARLSLHCSTIFALHHTAVYWIRSGFLYAVTARRNLQQQMWSLCLNHSLLVCSNSLLEETDVTDSYSTELTGRAVESAMKVKNRRSDYWLHSTDH